MVKPKWKDWSDRSNPHVPPYIDWAKKIGGELYSSRQDGEAFMEDADFLAPAPRFDGVARQLFAPLLVGVPDGPRRNEIQDAIEELVKELEQVEEATPKIPAFANNDAFEPENWLPPIPDDLELPKNSVIACVIDRGIALGHRAVRLVDGKTRIVAAWQQISDRSGAVGPVPDGKKLPFGVELLATDIDKRLAAHSSNGQVDGDLDEDAFNRAVGSEDYRNIHGHRELGRQVAHGTHVLNTAAGVDALTDPDNLAERLRIMTVNLPDRTLVGLSSRNLDYFVLFGLLRMIGLADKIWTSKYPGEPGTDCRKGFPVIINLSFAKQAGSKDADDQISRFMVKLNKLRADLNWQPVYLVTPTGNDNLRRGNAWTKLKSGKQRVLEWRIAPEDQSSNYVEVWSQASMKANGQVRNDALALQVTTPDGRVSSYVRGQPGQVMKLGKEARVYCEQKIRTRDDGSVYPMIQYVICTAPTLLQEADPPQATPGEWLIKVKNLRSRRRKLFVSFSVQTDQSDQPESQAAMLSYFDNEHYQRFRANGRISDTYNYPEKLCGKPPSSDARLDYDNYIDGDKNRRNPGPVRRHGTMNAIAGFRTKPLRDQNGYMPGAIIVGGHRLSDGRPASYSSTGLGFRPHGNDTNLAAPIAAMPVDDGYAHLGRLGAGARDGSVVAMQGTSFAAAQMTALTARLLLDNRWDTKYQLRAAVFKAAQKAEWTDVTYNGYADIEKVGGGRLPPLPSSGVRVPRT